MIKSDLKKRNWTFVLYDDSCPGDWEDFLTSTGVPFCFAYHDKDFTEVGEKKKEHTHVMLCYDGPTTYNTALEYAVRCGAANDVIQPVGSVRGMVRYFCHKDNPDKHQYQEDIIQCRNGFDPKDYFNLTVSQQKTFKKLATKFIQDNDIIEYSDLVDVLLESDDGDMYDIVTQNTFFFSTYIRSRRNRKKSEQQC